MPILHAWFSVLVSLLLLFGPQGTSPLGTSIDQVNTVTAIASPTYTEENDETTGLTRRSLADGATLRVLCLGASIVHGYASSSNNGFRFGLRGSTLR